MGGCFRHLMGVIPARIEIDQVDRATFDFKLQFFQDPEKTIPLDLTSKDVRCELWDERRKVLKGTFDVDKPVVVDNNEAYFRLQPVTPTESLRGTLWLDILFVEADSSPEGFRRDYYLQIQVSFDRGYTT
jgi:hypothetical protein